MVLWGRTLVDNYFNSGTEKKKKNQVFMLSNQLNRDA
jgi:hypothetical protein